MSFLTETIEKEISEKKGHIITDNVILSIGEIVNLYKDKDLNLNPDFQRFFRWNNEQKSRLIESIFLGLPIPSFFVYEDNNSIWEVLDGLQRISSLLQYIGELKNNSGLIEEPLKLEGLQYLSSLEGTTWCDLSEKMQRGFKKNSLPFIVMKNETTEIKKYQLFQRLNRGGSTLSEAEVRSCIILMAPHGKELMQAIDTMVANLDFQDSIWLSDRKLKEKADYDLVIRYLCFEHTEITDLLKVVNVGDYLNKTISELASQKLDYATEIDQFKSIFFNINQQLSKEAFRRFQKDCDRFSGQFIMAQYEAMIYAILKTKNCNNLRKKLESLSLNQQYLDYSVGGISVKSRWNNILELARTIFENE